MLPFSASDEAARARIPSFRETPNQLDDDIIDQGWGSEAQPTDHGEMPEQ
jgi:hypothetical protein